MANILIEQKFSDEIKSIIKSTYPNAVILAYGSRINGTAHDGSDLDLTIKNFGQHINNNSLFELKEKFKESNIPFLIDISDFNKLPESFQNEIEKKHIVFYDGNSNKKF